VLIHRALGHIGIVPAIALKMRAACVKPERCRPVDDSVMPRSWLMCPFRRLARSQAVLWLVALCAPAGSGETRSVV